MPAVHRRVFARSARSLAALAAFVLVSLSAAAVAAVPGFVPAPGYVTEPLGLRADTFAVAPDGRLAIAASTPNGLTVSVYNQAVPAGRRLVRSYSSPSLRYVGGLAFADGNTLLVSENGAQDTVFAIRLSTGAVTPLAPAGSIPDVAQVRVRPRDGAIFAVAAGEPGHGAIYRIAGGRAVPVATRLGSGYLGGFTFDHAGNLLVSDTNDPFFMGLPGRVLHLSDAGRALGSVSLAGGGGSGAYDIARDAAGILYVTSGATLTRVISGHSQPLGRFSGMFPFPTDVAVHPSGGLLVNGGFTEADGLFLIRASIRGGVRQPLIWPAASVIGPLGRR